MGANGGRFSLARTAQATLMQSCQTLLAEINLLQGTWEQDGQTESAHNIILQSPEGAKPNSSSTDYDPTETFYGFPARKTHVFSSWTTIRHSQYALINSSAGTASSG